MQPRIDMQSRSAVIVLCLGLAPCALHSQTAAFSDVGEVSVGSSPALPQTTERITLTLAGVAPYCTQVPAFDPPQIAEGKILIQGHVSPPPPGPVLGCPAVPWRQNLEVGPLSAGDYRVEVRLNETLAGVHIFTVHPPADQLHLIGERFAVAARWTDGHGIQHNAQAVRLSDESGYFWFFDSANVELTAKILDGRPITGHYWLFIASMTDVAYTVGVTDTHLQCFVAGPPCDFAFSSPAGSNQNFIVLDALSGSQ